MLQLTALLTALSPQVADGAMRTGHSSWPIILIVVALIIAAPLAWIFGRNRGRPET
jgi:hypothetical protein